MESSNSSDSSSKSVNENGDCHATENTSQLTLLQLYDEGKLHILEHCDLESILTLRKTCHAFHDLIDNQTPDSKLEYIDIHIQTIGAEVILNDPSKPGSVHLMYDNRRNGCQLDILRPRGNKTKFFEGQNYLDVLFKDLKNIIKHQKTTLKVMKLGTNSLQTEVIERLRDILTSRNELLKVEDLDFFLDKEPHLLQILTCIDPSALQNIGISFRSEPFREQTSFSEEVCNLPQWKMAKTAKVWGFNSDKMKYCLHFTSFTVFLRKMMFEDLAKIKKMMLQTPTLQFIVFNCDWMGFPMFMNAGEHTYRMENDGEELIEENWVPTDEEEAEWQFG